MRHLYAYNILLRFENIVNSNLCDELKTIFQWHPGYSNNKARLQDFYVGLLLFY